ncbi:hypothetical protein LCGC14_0663100 [marine sediment metagenome]|uniref:Rad50/SbcC-type AAA domain-containing protein n=1 Tax=marine sediment metagenome TaxID=412755 RepID=A0A0F9RD29_9ZZZZ
MHITKLIVSNIMRVKAIQIEPDGNMVVLSGKNRQGKTSLLHAIWLAIEGAAASKVCPSPLRRGESQGFVEVHLGDLVIRRTWKEGKTSKLVVKSAGKVQRSPQRMLDELIGQLSFDPLAFDKLKSSEQRAMLLKLVTLSFDPDKLEAKRTSTFAKRTDVNRDVRRLEAQLEGIPQPAKGTPAEEVSVSLLIEEHDKAVAAAISDRHVRERADSAATQVANLRGELKAAIEWETEMRLAVEGLPELRDSAEIKLRIDSAEETNVAVRRDKAWMAASQELTAASREAGKLTAGLEAIDKEKTDGLRQAKMPVDGLGFTPDGVTYMGSPFEQVSGAERWRICMAIAMALNPKLRVIRITEGSLLDSESRALLEATVIKNGFQCWMECVSDEGGEGFVIEDGELVEVAAAADEDLF